MTSMRPVSPMDNSPPAGISTRVCLDSTGRWASVFWLGTGTIALKILNPETLKP